MNFTSENFRDNNSKRIKYLYFFAGTMALIVSTIYFRISQTIGRLHQELMFDDITYVNDAVSRLTVGYEQGLVGFLSTFVNNPPHSPFSTLLACAALIVGGYHDSAVYVSNSILLIAAALFLVWLFKHEQSGTTIWIVTVFLCSPFAYRTIHDFKPDIVLGFVTAIMVCFFALGLTQNSSRYFKIAGIAFGACLLVKPTFFVHTLALAFGLAVLHLFLVSKRVTFISTRISIPRFVESFRFLLIGTLVALPYIAINGREIFHYFWDNTRGTASSIWSYPADTSLAIVAKEFLLGSANVAANRLAGAHIIIIALSIVAGLALMMYRRNIKSLMVSLILLYASLISFLIIVVGRHKNDFFLASFYSMLFFVCFFSFSYILQESGLISRRILLVTAWFLLALSIYKNSRLVHWEPSVEAGVLTRWNSKVVSAIANDMTKHEFSTSEKAKLFVSIAGPVNAETIKWTATKQGVNISPFDQHRSGSVNDFVKAADESHYILVPNEKMSEYYRWLPSATVQSTFLKYLRNDPQFQQIRFFSNDDHYYLFVNRKVCAPIINVAGITSLKGFGPAEGPYPQWSLPRVRWMNDSEATICFDVTSPGTYITTMRYRPESDGSLRITDQEGKLINGNNFKVNVFAETMFRFSVPAGQQCLHLSAQLNNLPDAKRLLLFTKLSLEKQP